jgi:hypothetical protein
MILHIPEGGETIGLVFVFFSIRQNAGGIHPVPQQWQVETLIPRNLRNEAATSLEF